MSGESLTLTFDDGSEFTNHKDLVDAPGVRTFFADSYCTWQSCSNEHLGGWIRRCPPKRNLFTEVSDQKLAEAVREINKQPRKCMGSMIPTEAFQEQRESLNHHVVLQNEFGQQGLARLGQ